MPLARSEWGGAHVAQGEDRPGTVWMWPRTSELNVYSNLLTGSLIKAGLDIRNLRHGKLMLEVGGARAGDTVHMHWIHHAYQHRNPLLFIVKSFIFIMTLLYLRLRKIGIVWTVHNLYPHGARHIGMEKRVRSLVCKLCTGLIVASDSIKRKVIKEFGVPESKLAVVKHGHYLDVYKPQGRSIRELHNIAEEDDVFLFLGAIKPYKGIEDLIEAFRMARTKQTHLIIAGKADSELDSYLQEARKEGIIVLPHFIPDEEVADLMQAADIMVLPYKEITTSGSAILGLSFRKLVVMPDNEFIDDYFLEGMAISYDAKSEGALARALEQARGLKRARQTPNYEEALRELDWEIVARKTEQVYYCR